MTYRPGLKLVKNPTNPKVYAVAKGGVLRWVTSVELAIALYGEQWYKKLDDIVESFIVNYREGPNITAAK